jgi:DNA mismatch repair protein MutS
VLDRLEKGRAETGGRAAGLCDQARFAAAASQQVEESDEMRERLQTLDVDALTPKQALELLYELKREAGE